MPMLFNPLTRRKPSRLVEYWLAISLMIVVLLQNVEGRAKTTGGVNGRFWTAFDESSAAILTIPLPPSLIRTLDLAKSNHSSILISCTRVVCGICAVLMDTCLQDYI